MDILEKESARRNQFDLEILKNAFSEIKFFKNFELEQGSEALKSCYRHLTLESRNFGDVVFRQGQRGDKFYIILCGSVHVYIKSALYDE